MAVTPITIDGLPTLTINALGSYVGSVDGVNDLIAIYQNSSTSTVNVSRNTYLGLSSAPVGLTDSQTLTNKVLTSPTISSPTLSGTIAGTYTIGGTPTFPASVVTLTGSQTLTNKVLTSPTISAPTITNATISTDAVVGFSTSNSGTVFGLSIASGAINSANSINGASLVANSIPSGVLQTNSVSAANLTTSAIYLGSATIITGFTTASTSAVQVTGLTATVPIPAGARKTKITVSGGFIGNSVGAKNTYLTLWDGTVGSGTQIGGTQSTIVTAGYAASYSLVVVVSPTAGSKTYNVGLHSDASGTAGVTGAAGGPVLLLVEVS